nr:WD and tetratricopeptide repeats protein 1 isoform X1 [Ipomoea batatas]GMD45611.1 WD and tetratricopeptide repeats protein 1 isoform X1 [Ipomoea batatas]
MGCGAKKSLADPPKQFFSLKSCDISSTRPHLLLVRGRRKLPPLSSSQKKFPPPPCVNYRWKNDAHMAIRDCHRARKINPTSFRALMFIAEALSQVSMKKLWSLLSVLNPWLHEFEVVDMVDHLRKHIAAEWQSTILVREAKQVLGNYSFEKGLSSSKLPTAAASKTGAEPEIEALPPWPKILLPMSSPSAPRSPPASVVQRGLIPS